MRILTYSGGAGLLKFLSVHVGVKKKRKLNPNPNTFSSTRTWRSEDRPALEVE